MYLGTDLLATWGLNLEFGVAGVANFAYIALVAAGAYTYAVLTLGSSSANGAFQSYILGSRLPIVVALLAAMAVAGLLGCLIGATGLKRLRQDYQAMIMLVVSIMATTVIGADQAIVNGQAGLSLIPNPLASLNGSARAWTYVGLVAGVCVVAYLFLRRFTRGPLGRSLRAMRDDEDAAVAIGKNVVAMRLMVQGVGGAYAGLSGALLAGFIGGWSPSSWQYVETLALLTAIIVGGIGNDGGVFLGTVIVPVLILQGVQFLPQIASQPGLVEDLGWIILGVLTIAFIFVRSQGIVPERRPGQRRSGTTAPLALAAGSSGGTVAARADTGAGAEEHAPSDAPRLAAWSVAARTREPGRPPGDAAPGDDVLAVSDLVRTFGGVRAVDGASFSVRRGSITGLIGPNGAGKSTVLGIVSGFVPASSGSVRFDGENVTEVAAFRRARRGLVRTFQLPHEFGRLTTIENLLAAVPGQRGESAMSVVLGTRYWRSEERRLTERAGQLLEMFAMSEKAHDLARELSGGQKRMLEVMRALMVEPKLLLLDEPMAGLSPMLSERLEHVCSQMRSAGMSILFVEHELGAVERLCDHVVVMAQGSVLSQGTMADLRSNKEVQDAYIVG
ncbi:MAG: branched-chain amino acid ABC transporter ATP-binding protein/permease [Actinomycetota bacterium]|nr:branched-chain amino acid ABC transporter ATP-binding protein/permease [Actinomycetota bacterium]